MRFRRQSEKGSLAAHILLFFEVVVVINNILFLGTFSHISHDVLLNDLLGHILRLRQLLQLIPHL